MAYNPPKGPGKGPGNGNPKAKPFGSDAESSALSAKGRAKNQLMVARAHEIMASDGIAFIAAKARAWREFNPEAAAQKEREQQIKEMIQAGTEDALSAMHDIILDVSHKDRLAASKAWVEQDIGRAKQAMELAGKDGQALTINLVKFARNTDSQ